jgi:hypothetical protein
MVPQFGTMYNILPNRDLGHFAWKLYLYAATKWECQLHCEEDILFWQIWLPEAPKRCRVVFYSENFTRQEETLPQLMRTMSEVLQFIERKEKEA